MLNFICRLFRDKTAEDYYEQFRNKTEKTGTTIDFTDPCLGHAISKFSTVKTEKVKLPLVVKMTGHGCIQNGDEVIIRLHGLSFKALVIELEYYQNVEDMFNAIVLLEDNINKWMKIYNEKYA